MFFLNTQSKEPIFEQIQNQILRFIQAGVLAPGDRLPSVRQLAQENGMTVCFILFNSSLAHEGYEP